MESPDKQTCGACRQCVPLDEFSPSYRGRNGTWCRKCFAAYHRGELVKVPRAAIVCARCNQEFIPGPGAGLDTRFCSRKCKGDARNAEWKAALDASKSDRLCVHCGGIIVAARRRDAMFCSAQCNSAAHQATRQNARKAGEKRPDQLQFRALIAERDGWLCGLCGKRVDSSLRHPDPMYGSIDHVVPLAAGGSNEMVNLQLAHLVCNLRKRHMGPPTQLSLLVVGPRAVHTRDQSHHDLLQKADSSCLS